MIAFHAYMHQSPLPLGLFGHAALSVALVLAPSME
jgi:hypothetical protein